MLTAMKLRTTEETDTHTTVQYQLERLICSINMLCARHDWQLMTQNLTIQLNASVDRCQLDDCTI